MMPREKWTDEKLDDLQVEMREGFASTKAEIADTKAEMREGFARVDGEIKRLDENIKRLDGNLTQLGREIHARFESVNRNQQAVLVAVVVALIGVSNF